MKNIKLIVSVVFFLFIGSVSAQQSGGGDDLKGVCELSGGEWTGVESGNWACCWPQWGCYGCVSGQCKMKCNTQRCRRANGMLSGTGTDTTGTIKLKAIVPAGSIAPVVPKPKPNISKQPTPTMNKSQ